MDEGTVQQLSAAWQEPEWLRRVREQAWDLCRSLPLPPPTHEAWRRTPPERLTADGLRPVVQPQGGEAAWQASEGLREEEPLLVLHNGAPAGSEGADRLRRAGVVFCDLRTAAREYAHLVEPHLFRSGLRPEENAFTAQHVAFATGGVFLYVPAGVEVDEPLVAAEWVDGEGLVAPHVLVVLEAQSRATLIHRRTGLGSGLVNLGVELVVQDGAQLRYVQLQDLPQEVRELGVVRARVGRDATVHSLVASFGASVEKLFVESTLDSPGGSSEMLGAFFADDAQHYDVHTLQEHQAPHTASDLLYKVALLGSARSVFAGLIRVHPGAQKTNAFQSNRNLLLSPDARADSKPELEIMANDLRCTHGSAVSRLEEQHLFYLQTRGLTRQQAVHMIVEGFFSEVLDRLPLERVRLWLEQKVAEKMGAQAPLGRVAALRGLLEEVAGSR
ncbi:MAG: Fe-S cluster assembly protein SufD [Armatimonadota bacterium]|nr:Fe-S cluster assembly protein SufD [Armatimonadota bacterium]MDW8155478.1 Fe-S cluster assembly protein SufD [Armatimonadota bacterium]